MTVELAAVSPLATWADAFAALDDGVGIRELPFLTQLSVRADADAARRLADALGAHLPATPCTAISAGSRRLLWLGPDEWLVLDDPGCAAFADELRTAIGTTRGTVTDVSAQRTALALTGPRTRDLLAHGCAIDLHPSVTARGACVQTLLARVGVTIVVEDDAATDVLLLVRASFAQHLARWLIDAASDL